MATMEKQDLERNCSLREMLGYDQQGGSHVHGVAPSSANGFTNKNTGHIETAVDARADPARRGACAAAQ